MNAKKNLVSLISQRPITILLLCYSAAWGSLLLIKSGKWWDDWALFSFSGSELSSYFNEIGRPWWGIIHSWLISSGLFIYPLITFVLYGVVNLLFYKILISYSFKRINPAEALWASVVFSVLPMVSARSLAIFMPFILGLTIFFLAWLLLVNSSGKVTNQIILCSLFAFSFTTSSLIVFFAVPVIIKFLMELGNTKFGISSILKFMKANWIWLISPLIFWVPSRIFFSPRGIAQDYNSAFNFDSPKIVALFLCVLVTTVALGLIAIRFVHRQGNVLFYTTGICLVGLGAIPYIAVNKIPIFLTGFDDRYLLLAPVGISIFLLGIYKSLKEHNVRSSRFSTIFIIILLILLSNLQTLSLAIDNEKQREIVSYFQVNRLNGDVNLVGVIDKCQLLNVGNRDYTHYELSGMIAETRSTKDVIGFELTKSRILDFKNIIKDPGRAYFVGAIRDFATPNKALELTIYCSKGNSVINFFERKPLVAFSTSEFANKEDLIQNKSPGYFKLHRY